ncbi:hypothetical protein MKX01_021611 [Papaver californicum]|nr:hypothetical protein MKX01_021611 [Papaver californicum]
MCFILTSLIFLPNFSEEETVKKNGLQDAKFGGLNGGYPGKRGYQGGGGYPGNGEYQGGGKYSGNRGGYRNGGGYQGGSGHDGGGRGGGGRGGGDRCRHGFCDRGRYYRGDCYNRCCSAAQAKAFAAETTTVIPLPSLKDLADHYMYLDKYVLLVINID